MSGNACKWCGTRVHSRIGGVYLCGSSSLAGEWKQSDTCQQRSVELRSENEQTIEILKAREANTVEALRGHIEDLHKRIADAIDAARQADRFDVIEWDGGTAVVREDDNQYAWATSLDEIAAILEGKG